MWYIFPFAFRNKSEIVLFVSPLVHYVFRRCTEVELNGPWTIDGETIILIVSPLYSRWTDSEIETKFLCVDGPL